MRLFRRKPAPDNHEYADISAGLEKAFSFEARPEYAAGLKNRLLAQVGQETKPARQAPPRLTGLQLVGGLVFALALALTIFLGPGFNHPVRTIDNPVAPNTNTVRTFNGYREISPLSDQVLNTGTGGSQVEKEEAEYTRRYQQQALKKNVEKRVGPSKITGQPIPSIQPS